MFETESFADLFSRIADVRAHREGFLSSVRAGEVSLTEVFDRASQDDVLATLKVLPAVESLPESGKVQTRRAFEAVGIAEDAHLVDFSVPQLGELPAALAQHAR